MDPAPPTLPWRDRPRAELLRLTLPMALSMLSYSAMTLVDVLLVGRLGADQLAGVGLGGTLSYALACFGFGFLRAAKTLVSQAFGAGRKREAGAYLGGALLTGVLFGLVVLVVQWPLGVTVARWAATTAQGRFFITYLLIRSFGAPSAMLAAALREVRWGLGDARSPTVAMILANLVNIALGWLFVFRLGWGVPGAAWATVIAQTCEVAILALYQHRFGWGVGAMRLVHLTALSRLGTPTGLQQLLEVASFAVLASMIASLSATQMAAHQIMLQLISFSFMPSSAVGESVAVMVGQAIGAEQEDLVPALARRAIQLVSAYAAFCVLLLTSLAAPLVAIFTQDPDVQRTAVRLLYLAGLALLFDGVNIVARATLRAAGDVAFPMWMGVAFSWGLTLPLGWLFCFHLHLGAFGAWLGIVTEVLTLAIVQAARLAYGPWRRFAAKTRADMLAASLSPT